MSENKLSQGSGRDELYERLLDSIKKEFIEVDTVEYTEKRVAVHKEMCTAYVKHFGEKDLPDYYFTEEPDPNSDIRTRCRFWAKRSAIIWGVLVVRTDLFEQAKSVKELQWIVDLIKKRQTENVEKREN